ncbi:MAG: hypothetical protein QOG87_289 [Actinomycetota bacterium]
MDRWLAERVVRLYAGLVLFGMSIGLMVRAELGLGPWDVLHQGLSERLDISIGWVLIGVGALAMLAWIPLRERPGFGTVSNMIGVGLAVDATLAVLSTPGSLVGRAAMLVLGIVMNGVATGLYIGAGFGPGPRDGLMTGLARRGPSIRVVRTGLELAVLVVGFALGGSVGVGTVVFALGIGPLVHVFIPRLVAPVAPLGD